MDEKLKQAYLYDFYGEMLNDHQRRIYEDFVFNDLSLGEIASEEGISRRGVADMVKRCEKKLLAYEEKLHLVEKFVSVKNDVERIHSLTEKFKTTKNEELIETIEAIFVGAVRHTINLICNKFKELEYRNELLSCVACAGICLFIFRACGKA